LPGIIDEPGWTVGRLSSAKPVCGPDPSILRSIARRYRLLASDVNALLKSANGAKFVAPSVRLGQLFNLRPVNLFKFLIIAVLNFGFAVMPVPTAVPPSESSWRSSDALITFLRDLSMAFECESKIWP